MVACFPSDTMRDSFFKHLDWDKNVLKDTTNSCFQYLKEKNTLSSLLRKLPTKGFRLGPFLIK